MIKKKKKIGIIGQVAILFVISILASGFLTFYTQHVVSDAFVKSRTENLADQAADEVRLSIMEYPAHDWLLRYWYEHFDELEIEYDTDYEQSTVRPAITMLTIDMSLIRMFRLGPLVSLKGSPTVSPTIVALWANEPLPPK